MIYRLVIHRTLPGWNQSMDMARGNKIQAAKEKKQVENQIQIEARHQLRRIKFKEPVIMRYEWYEPNKRRDKDNIACAKKYVQDALVKGGYLKNDGWKDIEGFSDKFFVDAENPRVEVVIMEVEE